MNPPTSRTNAVMATIPPCVVRRQLMWGLALSAIVATVPRTYVGVPPGARVGVVANALRVTRCTNLVVVVAGRPDSRGRARHRS
jgi:hypothetical protein